MSAKLKEIEPRNLGFRGSRSSHSCPFKLILLRQAVGCNSEGFLVVTKFSDPDPSGPVFYYDPPTNVSFGAGPPNVRDPFEVKWVELVSELSMLGLLFSSDMEFSSLAGVEGL